MAFVKTFRIVNGRRIEFNMESEPFDKITENGRIYVLGDDAVDPGYFLQTDLVVGVQEYSDSSEPNSYTPPVVLATAHRIEDLDPATHGGWRELVDSEEWYYVNSCKLHETDMTFKEFLMATFEDTIISQASGVSALEELLFGKEQPITEESEPMILGEGQKWFSDVFGWTPVTMEDFPVSVWWDANADEEIPELDPYYVWPKEVTEAAAWAIEAGMIPRLIGLPGTGKTQWAICYAAVTGRCLNRINFNKSLFLEDLVAEKEIVNGDTVFNYKDMVKYSQKASVQILDELSRASANINMALLQRFLEKKEIKVQASGEVFMPHPGMAVIVCDNTAGVNDNSDMFPTADVQDVSTLNRFPITLKVGYMTEEEVVSHIKRMVPTLANVQAAKLAKFTSLCQMAFAKREITLPYSARQYIPTARMAVAFKDVKRAIEYNFVNALDEEDAQTVRGFMNSVW